MRPLAGVRVLDFSTLLPGPLATLVLAEAGAEVIKIERPEGEDMRAYPPRWGGDSVNFALLNRGKKSIAVDLKDEDARRRVLALAAQCDVLVEQFRPGVMDRLGFGYEAVRAINPRIVYCAITGYGHSGPRRDRAGHDLNYIGDTGLLAQSCGPQGQRVVPPVLIADIAGGTYPAVMNILLALRQRDLSGAGTFLDIAMTDSVFAFMYAALGSGQMQDKWPRNGGELTTGGSPRYRLYDTRDGRVVAAAPLEQKFWEAFCQAIALEPEFVDDARNPGATIARVAELIGKRTAREWAAIFEQADCCCTIVQDARAALADPHFRARGLFDHRLANHEGAEMAALPVPVSRGFRAPAGTLASAPALGAHNAEFGF